MTLDEAIQHCEEVAEEQKTDAVVYKNCKEHKTNAYEKALAETSEKRCLKCAEDHRQLAEWLKLLKRILDSGDCNECGIKKYCQVAPPLGEQVRYNCPLFVRKEQEEGEQE